MPDSMQDNDNYPLVRPEPQAEAPLELVVAVFGALVKAGFPDAKSPEDFYGLRSALSEFLYGTPASASGGRTVTRVYDGGVSVVMRSNVIEAGAEVTGLRIDGPLGGL